MGKNRIAVGYDCLFPYTTGGGERLYRSYAERLSQLGFDVDYLTARQWSQDSAPVESLFRVVPVTGPLHLYDESGVRRSSAAVRFAWGLFTTLCRRRHEYDAVVISGLPVLNVFAARAALVGSGTQVVIDYLEVWGRRQWVEYAGGIVGTVAWMLQRCAVSLTPIATCHSRLTADRLRSEGLRGNLLLSPGLIDGDQGQEFSPEPSTPPYVLYAGRHIPDKQVDSIPAAVAEARRSIPDLGLVLLGSGPDTPKVDQAIRTAAASQWTRRPGFVSQHDLDDLMAGASALINPSRREGYGLVVVEAAAHGTPVVLVNHPMNAAIELVENDVNGVIADSASPADLGLAIVRAVRGGASLRRTARSWYETAITTRTISKTVDGIVAALRLTPGRSVAPDASRVHAQEEPK